HTETSDTRPPGLDQSSSSKSSSNAMIVAPDVRGAGLGGSALGGASTGLTVEGCGATTVAASSGSSSSDGPNGASSFGGGGAERSSFSLSALAFAVFGVSDPPLRRITSQ